MSERTLRVVRTAEDPPSPPPDTLLLLGEVAARLRVSRSTAYRLAQSGAIPTIRFAGSAVVRVSAKALDALIARGGAAQW